jgi:polysaccharide deacetylase family protein (PEP-CTERM system associated)
VTLLREDGVLIPLAPTEWPLAPPVTGRSPLRLVLSFDVEEHSRIEAASGLTLDPDLEAHCRDRLAPPTYWLLDLLAELDVRATFFVVGQVARDHPEVVRAIHCAGHEVASHGWAHRRVHAFTPEAFREDTRRGKDVLEQVTGEAVVGYRAPTFSVTRQTAWALDVLAELGLEYDSSVYPVRHDRYGVPGAPRWPFLARGRRHALLELPPATWRVLGLNVPAGGGGYFRLLPLWCMEQAIRQAGQDGRPAVAVLYFHPWEFDPQQRRLPLRALSRFRTYVGIRHSRRRLRTLLRRHAFTRAVDVARQLRPLAAALPAFGVAGPP